MKEKNIDSCLAKIEFNQYYKVNLYYSLKKTSKEQEEFSKVEEDLSNYISYLWKKFVLSSISKELSDLHPHYIRICKILESTFIQIKDFSINYTLESNGEVFIPKDTIYFGKKLKLVDIVTENQSPTRSVNIAEIIKKYTPEEYLKLLKDLLYQYVVAECKLSMFLQSECLNLSKRWQENYFYRLKNLKQLKEYNQQWYEIVYNNYKGEIDREIAKRGYRVDKLSLKKSLRKSNIRSEAVYKLNKLLNL